MKHSNSGVLRKDRLVWTGKNQNVAMEKKRTLGKRRRKGGGRRRRGRRKEEGREGRKKKGQAEINTQVPDSTWIRMTLVNSYAEER